MPKRKITQISIYLALKNIQKHLKTLVHLFTHFNMQLPNCINKPPQLTLYSTCVFASSDSGIRVLLLIMILSTFKC